MGALLDLYVQQSLALVTRMCSYRIATWRRWREMGSEGHTDNILILADINPGLCWTTFTGDFGIDLNLPATSVSVRRSKTRIDGIATGVTQKWRSRWRNFRFKLRRIRMQDHSDSIPQRSGQIEAAVAQTHRMRLIFGHIGRSMHSRAQRNATLIHGLIEGRMTRWMYCVEGGEEDQRKWRGCDIW